jgi:hypothetical protein
MDYRGLDPAAVKVIREMRERINFLAVHKGLLEDLVLKYLHPDRLEEEDIDYFLDVAKRRADRRFARGWPPTDE